jgi:hypothetical protein
VVIPVALLYEIAYDNAGSVGNTVDTMENNLISRPHYPNLNTTAD